MLQGVVDVTIYYPAGAPTLMDFLGSSRPTVRVDVRLRPLPAPTAFNGDTPVNATVAAWLNDVWQAKDAQLASLSNSH